MATKQDNLWGPLGKVILFLIFKSKFLVYVVFDEVLFSHGKEEEKEEGKKEEEEKERTLAKVLNDIQKRLHGARAAYWSS